MAEVTAAFFYIERSEEFPDDFYQWISDFEPGYTTVEHAVRWVTRKHSKNMIQSIPCEDLPTETVCTQSNRL